VGIHPQRQSGLSYAGFSVAAGRLRPSLLRRMPIGPRNTETARYARRLRRTWSSSISRTRESRRSNRQWARAASHRGLAISARHRRCTGSEFCKLALVETKAFSLNLIPDLERRLPNFNQHLRIHVTGCPNACGQHWIADIGLQGVQVEDAGQPVDGFELFVGGGLGRGADFAHRAGVRLPATRVAGALETLLRAYLATREEGEVFRT